MSQVFNLLAIQLNLAHPHQQSATEDLRPTPSLTTANAIEAKVIVVAVLHCFMHKEQATFLNRFEEAHYSRFFENLHSTFE
jgi:hypothetical protein